MGGVPVSQDLVGEVGLELARLGVAGAKVSLLFGVIFLRLKERDKKIEVEVEKDERRLEGKNWERRKKSCSFFLLVRLLFFSEH